MTKATKDQLFLKLAELEGSDDAQFEKILADLGVSFIKDKVPKIMQHLVGFLLLDKNEDHTEAFGVYIVRLDNSEFALIPLIFKNGKIFGYDILWLPSTKTPLPLTSDWFNFISSKNDNELAERKVRRDDHFSLGVMPPTLGNLSVPPGGSKTASAISKEYFIELAKDFLKQALAPINWPEVFLKLAQVYYPYSGIYLEKKFKEDPVFAKLFSGYKSYLNEFFKAARQRLNYINKIATNLKNYRHSKTILVGLYTPGLPDYQPVFVKKGSILDVGAIKAGDVRGESHDSSSNIYAVALYRDMVSNPQNTGIYDVYVSPYKTREMLVITDLQHPDIKRRFCVVVDISDKEPYPYTVCDKDKIWVDVSGKDHFTRLREWLSDREPAKSLEPHTYNILINKNGVAIGIVCVDYEYKDQEEKDQQEAYAVSFNTPDSLWPVGEEKYQKLLSDYKSRNFSSNDRANILTEDIEESAPASTLLILTKRLGKLRRYAGRWYIPGDFVAIQLEDSPRPNLIAPHAKIEMESEVLRRTSVINVMQKEGRFYINGKEYPSEEETLYDLVSKYKLTTKLAKDILTDVKIYGYMEFRIPKPEFHAIHHARSLSKEAYFSPLPPSLPHGSPPGDVSSSMAFMAGPNAQLATAPFAYPPPLPAILAPAGNPFETNKSPQAKQLQNVVSNLKDMTEDLKAVSISFENNANNMIEALTKVGQFLFKIYMNIDNMSRVFGPSNLAQMLINTRDAFKKLGALTLNLLLNSGKDDLEAGHSHDTVDVDIGEEYFS